MSSHVVILPKGKPVIRRKKLTARDRAEARAEAMLQGPVSPIARPRVEPRRSPSTSSLSSEDSEIAQILNAHPEAEILLGPTRIIRHISSSLSDGEE